MPAAPLLRAGCAPRTHPRTRPAAQRCPSLSPCPLCPGYAVPVPPSRSTPHSPLPTHLRSLALPRALPRAAARTLTIAWQLSLLVVVLALIALDALAQWCEGPVVVGIEAVEPGGGEGEGEEQGEGGSTAGSEGSEGEGDACEYTVVGRGTDCVREVWAYPPAEEEEGERAQQGYDARQRSYSFFFEDGEAPFCESPTQMDFASSCSCDA